MRKVRWLHISDLHMREGEDAPRQAVLTAMLQEIGQRHEAGATVDFVVVSGDLAFSGKRSEYALVAEFLGELAAAVGIPRHRLFCVPGNHDVQRDRAKTCFRGARAEIQSQGDVYRFLGDDDERRDLLRRQEDYRAFEVCFLGEQVKEYTEDALGYASKLEMGDLRIAMIGLNSSWLSEGGEGDDGKLLIGERQVDEAISLVSAYAPHFVLGLQHHPFHLLQHFDRRPVQRKLERACDLVHCGHLHDPQVKEVVVEGQRCITITAGASFESRGFLNTFTTVEFDPLAGKIEVAFVQYNPQTGAYEYESRETLDHPIDGPCDCTVEELADAIDAYCADARTLSSYLASLLLGFSSDFPIVSSGDVEFGNWELMAAVADPPFRTVAENFGKVGRAVRLLHGTRPLSEILAAHGHPVRSFARCLNALSEESRKARDYLTMQDGVRARQRPPGKSEPLRHTIDLLMDLIATDKWNEARTLAERTIDVSEGVSRVKVARALALCLARSTETKDKTRAAELYGEVVDSEQGEPGDWGALATILAELDRCDEGKGVIRDGIRRFPDRSRAFVEIGLRLVQVCGDRDFRNWLLQQGEDIEE